MVVQRENGIFGWRFLCNFLFIKMRGGRKVENCVFYFKELQKRERKRDIRRKRRAQITMKAK